MPPEIDFTKGGYKGDGIEEGFKPYTSANLEYWWHFREVLRASDRRSQFWLKAGAVLPDNDQKELIAISLMHLHVFTCLGEAITYHQEMLDSVKSKPDSAIRRFEIRRKWKAIYSSLYTSFTSLGNLVCVVGCQLPLYQKVFPDGTVRNYMGSDACKNTVANDLRIPMERCSARLDIRHHLDHYWLIWADIGPAHFRMPDNFEKGIVTVDPKTITFSKDVITQSKLDIEGTFRDYNEVYKLMSFSNGYLDKYLKNRGWEVQYSDFGVPHNGKRPIP